MQNSCVAEPEHQSAHGHVPKQTFLSDMHVPLKHTHKHTHYMANKHIVIHKHQQTVVFHKT